MNRFTQTACLLTLILGVMGCQNKKIIDETEYVNTSFEQQWERAHSLVNQQHTQEALVQLHALSQHALSAEQSRWVRDEIVKIYIKEREDQKLLSYLDARDHLAHLTADERMANLLEKAETYHRMSYNHWARTLGMGNPYRHAKAAMEAKRYYELFLKEYPSYPQASAIHQELANIDVYLERYKQELSAYQAHRKNKLSI